MSYPDFDSLRLSPAQLRKLLENGQSYIDLWMQREAQDWEPHLTPQAVLATWGSELDPGKFAIEVYLLTGGFDTEEEKRRSLSELGLKTYDEKRVPLAVMVLTETWSSQNLYREDGTRQFLLCEEDPNRRENASVFLTSLDQQTYFASREIRRPCGRAQWAGDWQQYFEGFEAPLLRHFFRGFFARCKVPATVGQPG